MEDYSANIFQKSTHAKLKQKSYISDQWRAQEFCSEGVQQIQLRTERTGIWGR